MELYQIETLLAGFSYIFHFSLTSRQRMDRQGSKDSSTLFLSSRCILSFSVHVFFFFFKKKLYIYIFLASTVHQQLSLASDFSSRYSVIDEAFLTRSPLVKCKSHSKQCMISSEGQISLPLGMRKAGVSIHIGFCHHIYS